ncbi:MAG TPA: hypothetical protein VGM36_16320 [Rhizomicrobium sp.]|jgi:hypothetical protein
MSELITTLGNRKPLRWRLLGTVSALAFAAMIAEANAEDSSHPTLWIELGGQLQHMGDGQDPYMPPFTKAISDAGLPSPASNQHAPLYSIAGEGKISLMPEGSNWVFSAGIRYGRSSGGRDSYKSAAFTAPFIGQTRTGYHYVDIDPTYHESHTIVDFQAGKDIGLGLFGHNGVSTVSLGVRVAQFSSKASVKVNSDPDDVFDLGYLTGLGSLPLGAHNHAYHGQSESERSFTGVGPSIEWDGSAAVLGSPERGEVTFDWGANAAILFGRQKANVHEKTTPYYLKTFFGNGALTTGDPTLRTSIRSRSVVVPNLGGFAGLSMKFPNAKVGFGYRVDYFFGAMDQGGDARHTADMIFHGPFASISIGF